jgi:hypothetical protein
VEEVGRREESIRMGWREEKSEWEGLVRVG